MKLILLSVCLLFTLSAFSQVYEYSFRCDEVSDIQQAKYMAPFAAAIFDESPAFDPHTLLFSVTSEVNISAVDFIHKLADKGYTVIGFHQTEFKNEESDQ